MQASEVAQLIRDRLPAAEKVEVVGGEGKFEATVIGPMFAEMSRVKRHQTVYATVKEEIASGAVHALSIRALTPAEAGGA